jgi:hypothetical protein
MSLELPGVGLASSKKKIETKFILDELPVKMPDGKVFTFYFDGNSKITLKHRAFDDPSANAFSLVQVSDCPFATPTCSSVCYVHGLEKKRGDVHEKYEHNSRTIREVLKSPEYRECVVPAFANYIFYNAPHGFRWHVSGDLYSLEYTKFVAEVSAKCDRMCWIYTRSFCYIPELIKVQNLVLNLSCDKDNYEEAYALNLQYGLRLCFLALTPKEIPRAPLQKPLPVGSVIFPSYDLRGRDLDKPTEALFWQQLSLEERKMVCPADFFGQTHYTRCGPCTKCLKPYESPMVSVSVGV